MDDATDARPSSATDDRLRRGLAMVAGILFCAGYWSVERGLPRGPAEFAFWPALEPLPFAAIRGLSYEQWLRLLGRLFLLGPGLIALTWGMACSWPRLRRPTVSPAVAAFALAGLGIAFTAWFQLGELQGRALVDDELTYAWQAELLADGRVTESRLMPWAPENFTIWTPKGATGKYLFGEPLVQIPGVLLGVPALCHLLLLGLSCWLWFRTVTQVAGPRVAAAATAILALSPMVLLLSATGLSHTTSLFAMIALGWGLTDLRRAITEGTSGWRGAMVAGTAYGFAATVRPQVAISFGTVLAAMVVLDAWRGRRRLALGVFLGAGLIWLTALLAYNAHLTGSMLSLPWSLASPGEAYGFGKVLEGSDYLHTPWRALENLLMVAIRSNAFFLGWPASLGLLVVWWRSGHPTHGAMPWLIAGAAQIVFHLGYYSPGITGFGPLYYCELILPFAWLGGYAIDQALERRPRLTAVALAVHILLGTCWFLVEQSARLGRMASLLHDQPSAILAAIEPPALLIYEAWPSESVHLGWIGSGFPQRMRGPSAAIVTYPRSGPRSVASLRALYADRDCWYSRVDPKTFRPDLRPCSASESLLSRPFALEGPRIAVRPTAMTLGLLPAPGDHHVE